MITIMFAGKHEGDANELVQTKQTDTTRCAPTSYANNKYPAWQEYIFGLADT